LEEVLRKIIAEIFENQFENFAKVIKTHDDTPEILTLPEAAIFLRVSADWLRKNIKPYKIPFFKVGTDYRFRKKQLLDWIDNNIEILSKYKMKKCS